MRRVLVFQMCYPAKTCCEFLRFIVRRRLKDSRIAKAASDIARRLSVTPSLLARCSATILKSPSPSFTSRAKFLIMRNASRSLLAACRASNFSRSDSDNSGSNCVSHQFQSSSNSCKCSDSVAAVGTVFSLYCNSAFRRAISRPTWRKM